jgi:hypothetical protein
MRSQRNRHKLRRVVQGAVLLASFLAVLIGSSGVTRAQTFKPGRFPVVTFTPAGAGSAPSTGNTPKCPPNTFAALSCQAPTPVPAPAPQCPSGTVPLAGAPGCQTPPPQTTCPPGMVPLLVIPGCQTPPMPQPATNCPAGTQLIGNVCQTPTQTTSCPVGTQPATNGQGCQSLPTTTVCTAGTEPAPNGQGCQTIPSSNPTSVRCADGSTASSPAACPAPVSSSAGAPTLALTVTMSNQNPVKISFHANQYLDLTHSAVFNLDPAVQATSVQVSTGSATIQGSQVVWNGFTMNAGDDASATVNLVVTGGTTLMASGGPSIQSVAVEALDQSGNQVVQFNPGGGPLTGVLTTACTNPKGGTVVTCTGSGTFSTPQFTVNLNWDLVWSFGSCPDAKGSLTVNVLNPDGSQMDIRTFSQPPASNAGTQHYTSSGTFSFSVTSPCSWALQALQD